MDVKIYSNDLKFKFRVSGIIIYDGKVLVNQYGTNSYCLPGGYVQIGEDSKCAILREMKEETDLEFEIINFCGISENFFTNLRGQKTHGIDFYYYLKLKDNENYENLDMNKIEKGEYSDIHHHFKWIDISSLEQCNLLPTMIKDIIKKNENGFHFIIKDE